MSALGFAPFALPLLVHGIGDSGQLDAITPYGYPGAAIRVDRSSPPDPGALDWSDIPNERREKAYTLGLAYAARKDAARIAEQADAIVRR